MREQANQLQRPNRVARLDEVAGRQGVSRSELLRRGALALLEAEELRAADAALQDAYWRAPQDPAIVEAAARLGCPHHA